MWSPLIFCLLAFASASPNPGFKDSMEYVYSIRGRTLASLNEVADQYTGIMLHANLKIQPETDGDLWAKVYDAKVGEIHSDLPNSWYSDISDSEMSYKPLPMSEKPFKIVMKNGVVRDLVVSRDASNWEVNVMKSIVSQFQLDTKAENLIPSRVNMLPDGSANSAVFKTMEDTITGKTETLYSIHPVPEYTLQDKPWLTPHWDGEETVLEITKNKNYSRSEELPTYHFGFAGMEETDEPSSNKMGEFFVRVAESRAYVTGNLNRYTIQHTSTMNQMSASPNLYEHQKGQVVSYLNLTLTDLRPSIEQLQELTDPVSMGNLVYRFSHHAQKPSEMNYGRSQSSEEENYIYRPRVPRSSEHIKSRDSSSSESSEEIYPLQEESKLTSSPKTPLLPYNTGYKGQSIKEKPGFNVVEKATSIAQQIGQELQQSDEMPKKDTLSKFTILTALVRVMDAEELKQLAENVYNREQSGQKYASWVAVRDAIAESGTGPAFLTIQELIQMKKIQELEAALVISTMTQAIREPTYELMTSFYTFVKKPEVVSQKYLNETALLAYTNLLRKVYTSKQDSHDEYPVHTYGPFRTQQGKSFVTETVIPELTSQLNEAIARGDRRQIHVYIQALGNIAHQKILPAFEPYLEGKKQASQFQRLLMLVAMNKLTRVKPSLARSVFYKIYQNVGESQELRVVAVYKLMATYPPADIIQHMASNTQIDQDEQVNSAVKSSILTMAELDGEEFKYLRSAAQAAKPFLTDKEYGVNQAKLFVRNYVVDEMRYSFTQTVSTIGSEDSLLPKGLKYLWRTNMGGLRRDKVDLIAVVSSITDLEDALRSQTKSYRQAKQQIQQEQSMWSSEKIAKILSMDRDEQEQLEGALSVEFGSLHTIFSFDNHTIENLPEVVREIEETLKKGKRFEYTKLMKTGETIIAFPTEMGFPCVYSHSKPTVITMSGHIQAIANPPVSSDNYLQKPDTVNGEGEIDIVVSSKSQAKLSFVTPYDSKEYVAGFDKSSQMRIPLKGKFEIDVKDMQFKADLEPKEQNREVKLLHYRTWPYTSVSDIFEFQPVSLTQTTKVIQTMPLHSSDNVFGMQHSGMAFRVQISHERQLVDLLKWFKKSHPKDILPKFLSWMHSNDIQYFHTEVSYVPSQSSAKKFTIRMGHQNEYKSHSESVGYEARNNMKQMYEAPSEPLARQQDFTKKVSAGIRSSENYVCYCAIEFHGPKNIKYSLTSALGKSNVDPQSRVLVFVQKTSNTQDSKPYQIALSTKSYIPNTNALGVQDSLKTEPSMKTEVEIAFGVSQESSSKMKAHIEMKRTEGRKQYLLNDPVYHQCQREMQKGNNQLPACANMTVRANLLDRIDTQVEYENVKQDVRNMIYEYYERFVELTRVGKLSYMTSHDVLEDEDDSEEQMKSQSNQVNIRTQFSRDLRGVNVTMSFPEKQYKFKNIHVSELGKQIFVPHPVFHLRSRLMGYVYGEPTNRPTCVVDQEAVNTFNNRTYPLSLDKEWTVLMQYIPPQARPKDLQQPVSVEEQMKHQIENYAVLIRMSEEGKDMRDVKITLRAEETEEKYYDITMKPNPQASGSEPKVKVFVNEKEIQINDQESYDISDGFIQIYALPNGEVKVEVEDAFYMINDGERVKLTAVKGKLRDSVMGICGSFNEDKASDFVTPNNCIVRSPREFVESYRLPENQRPKSPMDRKEQCQPRKVIYTNVISDRDAGRQQGQHSEMRSKLQTRYVEQNQEICFTLQPLHVCLHQQRGTITKRVPVHCIQKSNVANLWKKQIDNGSSPDFSHKPQTRTIQMELPRECL